MQGLCFSALETCWDWTSMLGTWQSLNLAIRFPLRFPKTKYPPLWTDPILNWGFYRGDCLGPGPGFWSRKKAGYVGISENTSHLTSYLRYQPAINLESFHEISQIIHVWCCIPTWDRHPNEPNRFQMQYATCFVHKITQILGEFRNGYKINPDE